MTVDRDLDYKRIMANPLERFKETNYLVKQLGAGGFSTVYLSIPKTQANAILQKHSEGKIDDIKAASELRGFLEASKILDVESAGISFNNEVSVLLELNVMNHPNIIFLHDYDRDEFKKEWIKLEPFPGGSLEQYAEKVTEWHHEGAVGVAPAAFGWHLIHQMSQALSAFHFPTGAKISYFAHGDLEPKNLLFRSISSSTGSAGYPDIVLADMGLATRLTDQPTLQQRAEFFEKQYVDARQMVDAFRNCFSVVMDGEDLVTSLDEVEMNDPEYRDNNLALKKWLEKLGNDSNRMRDQEASEQGGEFGPEAKKYFDPDNMTIDEIRGFWLELKAG